MIKATLVVFLLLTLRPLAAGELESAVQLLENEWATAYYLQDAEQQRQVFPQLLDKAADLVKRYPSAAEPKIWQATIMVTYVGVETSLLALAKLDAAKTLLEQAINLNPQAMEGSAYVVLGTLYYKVPAWPISFGDNRMAENLLRAGLTINPGAIDANYFYGEFLMQQGRDAEAEKHFHLAAKAPVRKQQSLADLQLQKAAQQVLEQVRISRADAAHSNRAPAVANNQI